MTEPDTTGDVPNTSGLLANSGSSQRIATPIPVETSIMPAESALPEIVSNPHILRWIVVIMLAALGYTVATVGMKLAADKSYVLAAALILGGFVLVIVTEVFLMRRADMTLVYVTIIGVETLMILAAGAMLGEVVDMRRILGAGCVVVGIALASS